MTAVPLVTVLIPARNERGDIERCLRAVLAQDHPHDRMEIVVVDGGSTDGTAGIASRILAEGDVGWKVVDNPVGTTPSNLNVGLASATGAILCRVDARSIIPREYVRLCVEVLTSSPEVLVTGGAQMAVAVDASARTVGIARALNNRYAMGGSRYRSGAPSGPSDTVYLGAFRTVQLRAAGGWDEMMLTNQDYELNRRLGRDGVVYFEGRLRVGYVPRTTLVALAQQYHRFGRWKVRYWKRTGDRPQRRQWALLLALPVALAATASVSMLGRMPPRRTALAAALATVGLLGAMDHVGTGGPEGDPAARAVGSAAIAVVGAGWLSGVLREVACSRIASSPWHDGARPSPGGA